MVSLLVDIIEELEWVFCVVGENESGFNVARRESGRDFGLSS
jgi:hypothetical protein